MMREFEIERQFNIKIEVIKPHKGVYYLKTDKGERCLKKINYGPQKLLFVYGAKEHLIKNQFENIDRYYLNGDQEPYALVNEDLYTLSQWIHGRECDFHNIEEVIKAAKTLANLHKSSIDYEPPENSKLKSDLERWPHLMEKRVKSFDKMWDMARKKGTKSEYDLSYMRNMEFYRELGNRAKRVLASSKYDFVCQKTEEDKIFCHHDYTYHNIIIDDKENYNVIDFDYCKREIRSYDIANFMIKVLKRNNWDLDFAKAILKAYDEEWALYEEEYRIIFAFLLFPQRFWRLANRYYYNEVNWGQSTFLNKMDHLVEEKENYLNFIELFKKEFSQQE